MRDATLHPDEMFLRHAELAATRSTCARRAVGAAAVDGSGRLLAVACNGPPPGIRACGAGGHRCAGASAAPGRDLDACDAAHAEAALLAGCRDPAEIYAVYLTTSPCVSCAKLLALTGCRRLVYRLPAYADRGGLDYWARSGRAIDGLAAATSPVAPSGGPRRVLLESPYAGDVAANVAYARRALRDSLLRGEVPIASHLLYAQRGVLDDELPTERELGLLAGHAWLPAVHAVVAYLDRGVSPGMARGLAVARELSVPVEQRWLGEVR